MTELFSPNNGQTPPTSGGEVDYVEYAKTKFKDEKGELDVVALAKGKYEADQAIAQRNQELAGLRSDLDTRLNMEQLLADLKAKASSLTGPEDGTPNPSAQPETIVKPITDEELRAKYQEFANQEKQKESLERNVAFVREELTKAFGSSFEAKVLAKASELGVNREFLTSMAATAPKAFLELVGAHGTPRSVDPNVGIAPRSSLQSTAPSGTKNYAYYQKLMKDDPREYWSVRVQKELHAQALKQGDAFYQG